MADRTFKYDAIAGSYQEMNNINNDIATILSDINREVENKVNVCDEAIFGDLGKQMLLDWDNTSANFDSFVSKFNNWSTLVTQAAGNYSQFESDISGFKQANPLGVTSGGITDAYTNTGFYSNSYSLDEINQLSSLAQFYELTGATYVDTGMVSFAKKNKIYNIVTDGLTIVSTACSAFAIFKGLSAASSTVSAANSAASASAETAANSAALNLASKSAGGFASSNLARAVGGGKILNSGFVSGSIKAAQNAAMTATWYAKFAGTYAANIAKGTIGSSAFWSSVNSGIQSAGLATGVVASSSGVLSSIGYAIGSNYDPTKYASGYENSLIATGTSLTIDNQDYVFVGSTSNGTNIFSNENNEIFYYGENGIQHATVTNSSGTNVNATFDNIGGQFQLNLGNEVVTENDSLNTSFDVTYDEYYDSIANDISTHPDIVEENN